MSIPRLNCWAEAKLDLKMNPFCMISSSLCKKISNIWRSSVAVVASGALHCRVYHSCLFVSFVRCFSLNFHVYLKHRNSSCKKTCDVNIMNSQYFDIGKPHKSVWRSILRHFLFPDCSHVHAHNIFTPLYFQAFPYSLHSLRVAEDEVFAQRIRAARILSQWSVMNILLHCYVIYALELELKAPTLNPLISGTSARSVLINWSFLLLYKHQHRTPELEVISGWLLMILKTDWV